MGTGGGLAGGPGIVIFGFGLAMGMVLGQWVSVGQMVQSSQNGGHAGQRGAGVVMFPGVEMLATLGTVALRSVVA